ncbi:hypothetical protein IJT17_10785, partial [bacterium]|nr:hypothetical protein [bacterium]
MPTNSSTNTAARYIETTNLEIPQVVNQVITAIDSGSRFLMVPHIHIDGDDLGCMIGLALALRQLNKEVYLYTSDPVPERYRMLNGHELITNELPSGQFDAVFILECPNPERLPNGFIPKKYTQ